MIGNSGQPRGFSHKGGLLSKRNVFMSIRVFIYGSCVSRDIFNFDSEHKFELVDYYARSSLAILPGTPYPNDDALCVISSAFQRRMVSRDFSREILEDSRLDQADIILLDLIDERFDLVLLPSNHIVTASGELLASGFLRGISSSFRLIKPGTIERRDLWLKGVDLLFHRLQQRDLLKRVIVNKVFLATKFANDATTEFPTLSNSISSINQELSWMYQALRGYLTELQFLEFDDETLLANSQHRWGPSPFHYVDDYYRSALMKLESRNLPRGTKEFAVTTTGEVTRNIASTLSQHAPVTKIGGKVDSDPLSSSSTTQSCHGGDRGFESRQDRQ